ncbi:MAG TPA: hypothetical protein VGK17_24480 [Propionicimonas sp.]|jgi:hypothetical protein
MSEVPFQFEHLDGRTRQLMLDEVARDVTDGTLYLGDRLTALGAERWEALLRTACRDGDDGTLAGALGSPGGAYLRAREPNPRAPGEDKDVPYNAASTMAEGEFNRFYIRALCVRAITDGVELEVYRARASSSPDSRSQALLGTRPDAALLLADLRSHQGVATALGLPSHPNSGLSVRITS